MVVVEGEGTCLGGVVLVVVYFLVGQVESAQVGLVEQFGRGGVVEGELPAVEVLDSALVALPERQVFKSEGVVK